MQLGIWINRGAWNKFHHVTVEPTNGAPDPLTTAASPLGHCRPLPLEAKAHWKFSITLS
jgi:hypothetical protein